MIIEKLEKLPRIKNIKEELEKYIGKNIYRCPLCEKTFEWDDYYYNPAENIYTCPICLNEADEKEYTDVNALELFEDMFLAYKDRNQVYKELKNERN